VDGPNQLQHSKPGEFPKANVAGVVEGCNVCKSELLEPPKPTEPTQLAVAETVEDPDSVWMKFVFSDNDSETLRTTALNEAQGEPSQGLRPTGEGDIVNDGFLREWSCDISAAGTVGCAPDEQHSQYYDLATTTEACASHRAVFGSPSTGLVSNPTFDNWDVALESSNKDPSVAAGMNFVTQEMTHGGASDGTARVGLELGETESNIGSLAVEVAQSTASHEDVGESLRFARPKLFVGKLSNPAIPDRSRAISPVTMTKRKRGRPKKRSKDGRANIKSIPVYNGDPIEEFDDDGFGVRAKAEPSLFGELETE
jgi:hypothetical protein